MPKKSCIGPIALWVILGALWIVILTLFFYIDLLRSPRFSYQEISAEIPKIVEQRAGEGAFLYSSADGSEQLTPDAAPFEAEPASVAAAEKGYYFASGILRCGKGSLTYHACLKKIPFADRYVYHTTYSLSASEQPGFNTYYRAPGLFQDCYFQLHQGNISLAYCEWNDNLIRLLIFLAGSGCLLLLDWRHKRALKHDASSSRSA